MFVCLFVENYCTNLLGFGSSGNNGVAGVVCECGSSKSMMCVSSCVKCGCSNGMVCNGNRLVDGDMVLVNHGGFDNLVDGVNLVRLGNGIRLGNLNGVGFGNMFLNNDFSLNGNGHGNRDLKFF